jgi:hypothetical protein
LTSGSGDLFDRNTHKWFAPSLLAGFELMETFAAAPWSAGVVIVGLRAAEASSWFAVVWTLDMQNRPNYSANLQDV